MRKRAGVCECGTPARSIKRQQEGKLAVKRVGYSHLRVTDEIDSGFGLGMRVAVIPKGGLGVTQVV